MWLGRGIAGEPGTAEPAGKLSVTLASELLDRRHRFEVSFESVERVVVELWARRHMGSRIQRTWIDDLTSEFILGGHGSRGEHRPRGTRHLPTGGTEIVTGTTAADRDFLPFHNFWIVPAHLWRKTPQRLPEIVNSSEMIPYVPLGCST